ncbi:MAG: hypothetical protein E6Z83_08050 [Pantoea sp.]|uniref:hypothetical protein n=1 Tax=Pantoea sp. TaxID=69393 RepID=UPI00290E7BDA|nr:hypothetical protein [Pantoea sp.]MDU5780748.1 hypothetical protein [Pantoea sp.]
MNFIKRAWLWLITKHQKENPVSEPLSDVVSGQAEAITPASTVDVAPVAVPAATPAADSSTQSPGVNAINSFLSSNGVNDFEAAMEFVVDGVEKLGDAAKDELVALAKKYL